MACVRCALCALFSTRVAGRLTRNCVRCDTAAFMRCLFCATVRFAAFAPPAWCASPHGRAAASDAATISASLLSYAEKIHGLYWRNGTSASLTLAHLLRYMPRRDALQLFAGTDIFLIDFVLEEHVRLALDLREGAGPAWARDQSLVPDAVWLDHVLPYAFLNEKRDVGFRWRTKFLRIFKEDGRIFHTTTATEAMKLVAELVPRISLDSTLVCQGCGLVLPDAAVSDFAAGPVISWVSQSAPMNLSPQQTSERGGSCTGTAITMAAAARAVGIPVRIAGCSQSSPNDDHHWTEFYDPQAPPLFDKDFWHTKEGTSRGNAGGPWDALSAPMAGCLSRLVPKSELNNLYCSKWSGVASMPLLWGVDPTWSRIGSEGRCGAYCSRFGCGGHTYSQAECGFPGEGGEGGLEVGRAAGGAEGAMPGPLHGAAVV